MEETVKKGLVLGGGAAFTAATGTALLGIEGVYHTARDGAIIFGIELGAFVVATILSMAIDKFASGPNNEYKIGFFTIDSIVFALLMAGAPAFMYNVGSGKLLFNTLVMLSGVTSFNIVMQEAKNKTKAAMAMS